MNDWRKPCEHGNHDQHLVYRAVYNDRGRFVDNLKTGTCPGGSLVTAADLEGEKVWWCVAHGKRGYVAEVRGVLHPHCWVEDMGPTPCELVERLLIPLPDPVPAE